MTARPGRVGGLDGPAPRTWAQVVADALAPRPAVLVVNRAGAMGVAALSAVEREHLRHYGAHLQPAPAGHPDARTTLAEHLAREAARQSPRQVAR